MSIQDFYSMEITRERLTSATNSFGAVTESWGSPLKFSGLINQLTGDKRLSADKLTVYASHRMYCDAGTDIIHRDRIIHDDNIYTIKAINNPMGMGRFLMVDLEYSGVVNE